MRVVMAGGSGFLGQSLRDALVAGGHQVLILTRRHVAAGRPWDDAVSVQAWAPDGAAGAWAPALDAADAVVNLAGESIGGGRWTAARKARLLDSRLLATRSLVAALNAAKRRPPALLSASAQGYYGDRGDEELTEASAAASDFLADLCVRWEAEARRAEPASRVVLLRTGLVLSSSGGALPRMLPPFRLFGGGPFGSGRQFMSWIHLDDWVRMVSWALATPGVAGPLNLCAPAPVRNRDFAAALGRVLRRPSWMPAPGFALRIAVGEMAGPLLLASTRMVPAKAIALGFSFRYPELGPALSSVLG
jgi:uncharacterized protein (TIGR01777 family)